MQGEAHLSHLSEQVFPRSQKAASVRKAGETMKSKVKLRRGRVWAGKGTASLSGGGGAGTEPDGQTGTSFVRKTKSQGILRVPEEKKQTQDIPCTGTGE